MGMNQDSCGCDELVQKKTNIVHHQYMPRPRNWSCISRQYLVLFIQIEDVKLQVNKGSVILGDFAKSTSVSAFMSAAGIRFTQVRHPSDLLTKWNFSHKYGSCLWRRCRGRSPPSPPFPPPSPAVVRSRWSRPSPCLLHEYFNGVVVDHVERGGGVSLVYTIAVEHKSETFGERFEFREES